MGENISKTLESLLVSLRENQGVIKKIRYFEPDKYISYWPTYSDPVYQEINNIINKEGYRPFYIDSAAKTKKDGQELLELKGHYDTFDGLKIEIKFLGKYGDPKDHIGLFGPQTKEDSFSSFTLEAKVIGADSRQEKIFSSIVMRDSSLSFRNNILSLREYEERMYKTSHIALEKIRRIGKIITLYDGVHMKEKIEEIADKIPFFMENIKKMQPRNLYDINLEIYEYQDNRDMNPIFKTLSDHVFEFMVFTRLYATDNKSDNHHIRYEYAIEYDSWKIEVYWPSLNKLKHYFHLTKNISEETKHLMQKINFAYAVLNIRGFDREDIVDNSYDLEFDQLIYEARKEIMKKNPEYEPLVRTAAEGTIIYYESEYPEQGTIVFNSKEEYLLFNTLIFKSIEHKDWSVKQLMKDKEVHLHINKDSSIKRRVMTYYDCYRQNPEKAYIFFCRKDPAYVLAREKFEAESKKK